MNIRKRNFIKNYILDYIKFSKDITVNKKQKQFKCPVCDYEKNSASIYPVNSGRLVCYRPECNFNDDIFGLVRHLEKMPKWTDDDVLKYLTKVLKITMPEDAYEYLDFYKSLNWCLFPVSSMGDTKQPIEKEWQNSQYKNMDQWKEWIDQGLNVGLNIKNSGIVAVDVDDEETYQKFKDMFGNTLMQKTKKGYHFIYKYDKDFYKTLNKVLKDDGHNIELRVGGAYILIAPSSSSGEVRSWNKNPILPMPDKLKEFFMNYYDQNKPKEEISNSIQDAINNGQIPKGLDGLDGCCNDTFVVMGGILRKFCTIDQTRKALMVFNESLKEPMDKKDIYAMCDQLNKYDTFDKKELANKVLEHLDIVGEASSFEISTSLRTEKKDIEDVLKYLLDEDLVYKKGKSYKALEKAQWKDTFIKDSRLLDYKVPYFNDYHTFRNGDMVIIGARPGQGKSHIALNFIRSFVDQGIKPYYINLESGNRFSSIATQLKLKEGDFYWCNHYSPESIELEDNAVTIIDWILPDNYAETDKLYKRLSAQLDKHGGLLIIFVQLKKFTDKNNKGHYEFFAPNQIDMFPAFVCKYKYGGSAGSYDPQNTYFETSKIRESKIGKQYIMIPTKFDNETKLLELRK